MADSVIPRSDFYVYIIFRPNGVPCYVGKGRGERDQFHELKGSHNPHLKAIFKLAGGLLPRIRYRENLSNKSALALEATLIAAIGREIYGGLLVNQTDGGEGGGGIVRSLEYIEKQRKSQTGKKASVETRAKLSAVLSNVVHTPEWNSKVGRKGRIIPDRVRAKLSASWTPERKEELALKNAGNAYGLGNKRTPEGQARVTASIIRANITRPVTDEYRARRREIAKAMWARRKASKNERDGSCKTGT